jgi:hypothetical protein
MMRMNRSRSMRAAAAAAVLVVLAAGACRPRDAQEQTPGTGDAAGGGPAVRLTIASPGPGQTVPGPNVPVTFTLENYEVYMDSARNKGQHVHFILDNEPYIPHYSTDPFVFPNVPPGTHTIRAFPSREWHESIKDPEAFAMVTFHVQRADDRNQPAANAPLLTYSRPKGEYVGEDADTIMVDFWLKNAMLGPNDHRVRLTVDGQTEEILSWGPVYKTGLSMGPHTFRLELIGPDGAAVPGPFNVTERTITLKAAAGDTAAARHAH